MLKIKFNNSEEQTYDVDFMTGVGVKREDGVIKVMEIGLGAVKLDECVAVIEELKRIIEKFESAIMEKNNGILPLSEDVFDKTIDLTLLTSLINNHKRKEK